jgi:hypothetical protein
MGLVLILIWLVAMAVVGGPGLTMAGVVSGISTRNGLFYLSYVLALIASVAAQYWVALRPYLQSGTYGIELMTVPILSLNLVMPGVLAAILWFVFKARRHPVLAGATAGLLSSMPVVVALALPMAFWLPDYLHLKFKP